MSSFFFFAISFITLNHLCLLLHSIIEQYFGHLVNGLVARFWTQPHYKAENTRRDHEEQHDLPMNLKPDVLQV